MRFKNLLLLETMSEDRCEVVVETSCHTWVLDEQNVDPRAFDDVQFDVGIGNDTCRGLSGRLLAKEEGNFSERFVLAHHAHFHIVLQVVINVRRSNLGLFHQFVLSSSGTGRLLRGTSRSGRRNDDCRGSSVRS